jgi:hypothetical protein
MTNGPRRVGNSSTSFDGSVAVSQVSTRRASFPSANASRLNLEVIADGFNMLSRFNVNDPQPATRGGP